mmetsp:Transcript_34972/g.76498  ORF Transcript_34972/g.76498 Transcript_34972/m.76498 type:complete len:106 (+) Transcript_34972:686-1003(+)
MVTAVNHRAKLAEEEQTEQNRSSWKAVYGSSPSIASTGSTSSPLLPRMSRSGSNASTERMSYGSAGAASPSTNSYSSIRGGREELDLLGETDHEGLEFWCSNCNM